MEKKVNPYIWQKNDLKDTIRKHENPHSLQQQQQRKWK